MLQLIHEVKQHNFNIILEVSRVPSSISWGYSAYKDQFGGSPNMYTVLLHQNSLLGFNYGLRQLNFNNK